MVFTFNSISDEIHCNKTIHLRELAALLSELSCGGVISWHESSCFRIAEPTDTIDRNYQTFAIISAEVRCSNVRDSYGKIREYRYCFVIFLHYYFQHMKRRPKLVIINYNSRMTSQKQPRISEVNYTKVFNKINDLDHLFSHRVLHRVAYFFRSSYILYKIQNSIKYPKKLIIHS